MSFLPPLVVALSLVSVAQQTGPGSARRAEGRPDEVKLPKPEPPLLWVSGDTHEHLQDCSGHARPLEEIIERMEAEDVRVGSILIWNPLEEGDSFTRFVCLVTGEPDPASTPQLILQYGVETAGLDCDRWGHLIGMGMGAAQARIAVGSLAQGDCADMSGLGLGCPGGDGTGRLNWRAAERFFESPDAVCGYAHSVWTLGTYRTNGYDWQTNLVPNGYATDARCLDPLQKLAIPNLNKLIDEDLPEADILHGDFQRAFFPLLGAIDAVLGEAQFFETTILSAVFPLPFFPPANWHGLYYKLLSAGLRVGLSGGSDEACPLSGVTEYPQTYVWLDEPVTYDAWARGIAAGHTTLGLPGLRMDLRVAGRRVGEEVSLPAADLAAAVSVEVVSADALDDCVELIIDGNVYDTRPVALPTGGTVQLSFDGVPFPESAWVAARLCSQRAHTAATYVVYNDRPIVDCTAAEYWMVWCDIITKKALEFPQLQMFGCQEAEALDRIAHGRRAFKAYRDLEGFDPTWMVERFGRSTSACRGPIGIGTTGPAWRGKSLLLTCVNAPPQAQGVVHLSRTEDTGTCDGGVRSYVKTDPGNLIATFPAQSTRSGYAEVLIPTVPDEPTLFAQFVWTNPPGCTGTACDGGAAVSSSSDGLSLLVQEPGLVSIEVTPTNPSIALGTEQQFTALGTYADSSTQDLTDSVTWSSSSESVATVSNAPGSRGLASSESVGATTITATDPASSVSGATTLTVTPAVLVSIQVTPTNPSIALGTSQQFAAMGIFSDGSTQDLTASVTWSSSSASVATVSNAPGTEGLAISVAVGSTTITATDVGSSVSGATTLAVTPAVLVSIEVTPTNPSIALGTGLQFTATGTFSDATTQDLTDSVTWSSSSPGVATVSNASGSEGFATSVSIGSTTITAADPGSSVSGATTLAVTPAVLVSIEVTPTNPSIALGTGLQFTAMGIYSDGSTQDLTASVTWSSSSPGVATVSNATGSEGFATSVSIGSTTITAADPGSSVSGATTLAVTPAVLVSIEVTPTNPSIALGTGLQFTATGTFSDATTQDLTASVTWISSSPGVATVSNAPGSEGLATSVAMGSTTITATDPGSSVSGATTLTVTPAVLLSIEVTPTNPSVALGFTQQFTAIGTYSDATTQDLTASVTWASSSPSVATVSNAPGSEGLATSVSVGSTTCTATDPASSVSGATTLTVTPAILLSIEVTPTNPSIALGFTQQFTAIGTYSDATTQDLTASVTWASSSPSVATVSNASGSEGLATSVSVGSTTCTATDPASSVSGATTLTVTPAILLSIEVTPTNPSIALGFTQQFTAIGTYSDATTQDLTASATWSSSSPSVATVSNAPGSEGLATSVSVGSTTCTATDPASSVSGATTLTVTPAILLSIEVTPTNPSVALGFTQQFTAIGTYSDATTQDLTASATWASSSPSVATVSNASGSEGLATSVSVGSTTCTATDPASSVSGATTLTITPAVLLSIEVTPTNPSVALGFTQQFTAIGTYSDATTQDLTASVTWASSSPSVATVSNASGSEGLATSVSVGSTTCTATDPASSVSGATTLTVTPAILLSIEVTPTNPSVALGFTQQFTAIGTYSDATTQDLTASATWASSSPSVATVSNASGSEGLATSVSVGSTTCTATDPASSISGATTLTVTPAILLSIEVTPTNPSVALGFTQQFTAIGTYSDATTQDLTASATWSSSSPSVATVSNASGSEGLATSVSVGSTTCTATDPGSSVSGSTTLTVTPAVLVSIEVTPADPTISLGTDEQLTATGTYSDGTTQDLTGSVTWSSSSPGVATVSNAPGSEGLATSVSVGSTTITATDPGSSVSGATTLTVEAALLTIDVTPVNSGVLLGNTKQFTAIGSYNDGSTLDLTDSVIWSSSSPGVATISNAPGTEGLATSVALGITTITATDPESGIDRATTLRVLSQH